MNDPQSQFLNNADTLSPQPYKSFRVAVILIMAALPTTLYYLYLALDRSVWQLFGATGAAAITLVAGVISLWLSRRGRPSLAVHITIFGIGLAFLTFSVFIANFGLMLGIATILLGSLIATYALPAKYIARVIFISIILGVGMIALDLIQPAIQVPIEELELYVPIVIGLMTLFFGFYMIRNFSFYALRTKFIFIFLAITLVPLGILMFINNFTTRALLIDQANEILSVQARQTTERIDNFINTNMTILETEVRLPDLINYVELSVAKRPDSDLESKLLTILKTFAQRDSNFIISYALVDNQGVNVIDTVQANMGRLELDNDYFQQPIGTKQGYVSPIQFVPGSSEPSLYFSQAVLNDNGQAVGVLRVQYDAAILTELVRPNMTNPAGEVNAESEDQPLSEELTVILLDENYIRLVDLSRPQFNFKSVTPLDPAKLAELKVTNRLPDKPAVELSTNLPEFEQSLKNSTIESNFIGMAHPNAELEYGAITRLETEILPWFVVVVQASSAFLAPIDTQFQTTVILLLVIAVAAAAIALILAQWLATPITRLTATAQQVAAGDLSVQVPVSSHDETGQLARAFNRMTDRLQGLIGSLEQQVEERTVDLSLSIEVGQRAAAIRDLDALLPTIVEFIRERFNLYHVQIYLVNDLRQDLVLAAGTGQVGQEMLASRHKLSMDERSIVGQAAVVGGAITVVDTATC